MLKENDYQVGSGANFICAKIGPVKCNVLAAGDDSGQITLWKMTEVKPRKTFNCGTSVVNTLIFNDKVEKIFSGDSSGMSLCWDISKGQNVREYPGH